MSYPQSGGYGYGQNQQGGQQYGQAGDAAAQYGQQYGQYGQQQAYDPQAQYGQQYGQQPQYGYGAPVAPTNPGLPANTPTILAGVIGALGVITLFCGFLAGYKSDVTFGEFSSSSSVKLFASAYATPYSLISVAGVLALVSFLLGFQKWIVGVVGALTVVGALITIFQFASADGRGVGAIILLITAILSAIAGVVWLLVEGGQIKLAEAVEAPAAAADASAYGAQAQQAAAQQQAAPAVDYGYGYGQQAQAPQQTPAPQAQAQPQQPAQYAQTQYGPSAQQAAPAPGDSNATTAFVKPATDPGANPQSEQH